MQEIEQKKRISQQILLIILPILFLFTLSLFLFIGNASFNNLSTITLNQLDRMSSILEKRLNDSGDKMQESLKGMESNRQFISSLERLTNLGPYYVSDPSLIGRKIEDSEQIYSLQAQLELLQVLGPLIELHNLKAINIYQAAPFDLIKGTKPVLIMRLEKEQFWINLFHTKGNATQSSMYRISMNNYQQPSSEFFDVSSVYQLSSTDFLKKLNFESIFTNTTFSLWLNKLPEENAESKINLDNNKVPSINASHSIKLSISHPETWDQVEVPAAIVSLEKALDKNTMSSLKSELATDVAIAWQGKILTSSLNPGEKIKQLGDDATLSSNLQSYYYAEKKLSNKSSSNSSISAVALSPISALANLVNTMYFNMFIILLIATLIASIAIYYAIKNIVNKPLEALTDGVKQLSSGKLQHKLQIHSENELGVLSHTFNLMADELSHKSEELKGKIQALKEMDSLKDAFLANTSHELRTPLNGIIGITESMLDGATGELTSIQNDNLSIVVSSAERLSSLVNDILDFSKMRHHDITLELKTVDINAIANIVIALSTTLAVKKQLKISNQIKDINSLVKGDENRLQQILYNLIGNAIKFTDSGSIDVYAEEKGSFLHISVVDTGIGIPDDKKQRIFQSFEQLEDSDSRQYGGTGLGLAITKKLVELHQGSIVVSDNHPKGSVFTFSLPLAEANSQVTETTALPQHFHKLSTDNATESLEQLVTGNQQGSVKIILAVDDEPTNLQVISNQLSLHGYKVIEAESASKAFQILKTGIRPNLILMDVMMPGITGYEACQIIRQDFKLEELPIILLTAKDQVRDMVEGFESGANDYLSKPFSKHELLSRINLHINLSTSNLSLAEKEQQLTDYSNNLEQLNTELETYKSTLEVMVDERTQELVGTQKQLIESEKMASLGELVAGVAHEINTPVGTSITAATYLQGKVKITQENYKNNKMTRTDFEHLMDEAAESVDIIENNLRRAAELIKSFKQVAVDQSSESHREIDLSGYIQDILKSLHPRLKRTSLSINLTCDAPRPCMTDPGALAQVITNLVMNSITHAYDDIPSGTLTIDISQSSNSYQIKFSDDGKGIDEEHLDKIFEPFFTTKRGQGGSGLGLHLVFNLVTQKLGGCISCTSQPGEGTEFIIQLPFDETNINPALSDEDNS